MKYDYFTPFQQLSTNLRLILFALGNIDPDKWNRADSTVRESMVRDKVGSYVGKLNDDELAYLEDRNYHTACHILSAGKRRNTRRRTV